VNYLPGGLILFIGIYSGDIEPEVVIVDFSEEYKG
jgi:hypothetical protein